MSQVETHALVDIEEAGYQSYWWKCGCGDEGGPFPTYNHAWDNWVDHPAIPRDCPLKIVGAYAPSKEKTP